MSLLIERHPDLRVVAVCDPSEESLQCARRLFGVDLQIHETPAELCSDPQVSWVAIGSPNALHREHAEMALAAGRHVFCEKPLATTLEDCLALLHAIRESGRIFSLGLTLRYASFYRRIREMLDEGAIGRIISFEFNETLIPDHGGYIHQNWRRHTAMAGTHLLEKCCHDVDVAHWLIGGRPIRVASFGGCTLFTEANRGLQEQIGPSPDGRPAFQAWKAARSPETPFRDDKDIVDHQVAIIEFDNAVHATFHTNCSAAIPERRFYLLGETGSIRADLRAGRIEHTRTGWDEPTQVYELQGGGHGDGDTHLVDHLADSIRHERVPAATAMMGLDSAVSCFAIDRAMEQGSVIDLAEDWRQIDQALEVACPPEVDPV